MMREFQNSHAAPRQCRLWFLWDPERCTKFPHRKGYFLGMVISRCFVSGTIHSFERARSHLAVLLQVRSTSPVSSLLRKSMGAFLCLEPYKSALKTRAKSSDHLTGTPTNWSAPSLPTSPKLFGLKILRLRSQRFVAAAFAPLNAISAANENGQATQSPPLSPKFFVVTPCGTSRSFPSGKRRPF